MTSSNPMMQTPKVELKSKTRINRVDLTMEDKLKTLVLTLRKSKSDPGIVLRFDATKAFKNGQFLCGYAQRASWSCVKAIYPDVWQDAKTFVTTCSTISNASNYICKCKMMKEVKEEDRIKNTYDTIDKMFSLASILTMLEFSPIHEAVLLYFLVREELLVNWSRGEDKDSKKSNSKKEEE